MTLNEQITKLKVAIENLRVSLFNEKENKLPRKVWWEVIYPISTQAIEVKRFLMWSKIFYEEMNGSWRNKNRKPHTIWVCTSSLIDRSKKYV